MTLPVATAVTGGGKVSGSQAGVPLLVLLSVMAGYVLFGGILFASYHNWSFVDSLFFSFATLTTIGRNTKQIFQHSRRCMFTS